MNAHAPCRQLHRDKEVIFAGYKFPHPLEYHIFIKVQTMGKKSPREAFDDSLTDLINELDDIRSKFQVRSNPMQMPTVQMAVVSSLTCEDAFSISRAWNITDVLCRLG